MDALPDDVWLEVLVHLTGEEAAVVIRTDHRRRRLVGIAVGRTLDARSPRPASWSRLHNPVLQLVSLQRLEKAVGPRPAQSWKDDWVELMVETTRLQHLLLRDFVQGAEWNDVEEMAYREVFARERAFEVMLEEADQEVSDWAESRLPFEHAQAYAVLSSNAGEALFTPSPKFASAAYAMYDALAAIIRQPRASSIAPPVYSGLLGHYGLAEKSWENGWRKLCLDPVVGTRLVTESVSTMQAACERNFPEGKYDGIYEFDEEDGSSHLASTDVVCIRCVADNSAGRHNLFREIVKGTREDRDCYVLPPFAVVTLLSVQHKWRVRRQTMRCRLFTCEVTFDIL